MKHMFLLYRGIMRLIDNRQHLPDGFATLGIMKVSPLLTDGEEGVSVPS